MGNARLVFRDRIGYAKDVYDCIDGADCCLIVTEWDESKKIPPSVFLERMRRVVVIDCRRIYDADEFSRAGVKLWAIGLACLTQ
jgi:UDPglucose 6-dehydrogenase